MFNRHFNQIPNRDETIPLFCVKEFLAEFLCKLPNRYETKRRKVKKRKKKNEETLHQSVLYIRVFLSLSLNSSKRSDVRIVSVTLYSVGSKMFIVEWFSSNYSASFPAAFDTYRLIIFF